MPEEGAVAALEDEPPERQAVAPLLALVAELEPHSRLQALTHSSWTERRVHSWGRLAFLGDSVLGLAVAEHLFTRFPRSDIGRLTKIHGQAVSGRACAEIAVELGVPEMLAEAYPSGFEGGLAPAELVESERAMASIVESLIGACYLQFGLERTAAALLAAFAPQVELASGTCSTSSRPCRSSSPGRDAASPTRSPRSRVRRTTRPSGFRPGSARRWSGPGTAPARRPPNRPRRPRRWGN